MRENSHEAEAILVMAAIAIEHGNAAGALQLCQLAERVGYNGCWLYILKGRTALLNQDQESARKFAKAASNLANAELDRNEERDDPHIANQLGVLLSRTGWLSESVAHLQFACDKVPDNADYRYNYAAVLQFNGDLAGAEAQFLELVSRHPNHAKGWLALVQLAKAPPAEWAEKLERQFAGSNDTENRLLLGHALARMAELRQDWDQSLAWLEKAKLAKRAEVQHDRASIEALVNAAIRSANGKDIATQTANDERPLFIVGMPRSGTTLVERILTSHSKVVSVGELSDFAIILKRKMATAGPLVLDAEVVEAAAKSLDLRTVGNDYVERASILAGDTSRFIDKMPFNSFLAPAILRALPGARVICLRRSPHDLLFANFRQLFATGFSYYSYAYDFSDTAHFIAQFERMADAFATSLPSERFLTIRYEELVQDQRTKTQQLLNFCGLEWEDACIEFHRNSDPVATASSAQVRSPIYSSSIGQWQRYSQGRIRARDELRKYSIEA